MVVGSGYRPVGDLKAGLEKEELEEILEEDERLWASLGLVDFLSDDDCDEDGLLRRDDEARAGRRGDVRVHNALELEELRQAVREPMLQPVFARQSGSGRRGEATFTAGARESSGTSSERELLQLIVELEAKLHAVEASSIEHFVNEASALSKLGSDVSKCDAGLSKVEQTLDGFAAQLDALCNDMHRLEEETVSSAHNAKARACLEAHLSAFVDQIMLSNGLIRELVDGDVGSEQYEHALRELNKKDAFLELDETRTAAAYAEIKPVFDSLMRKTTFRVRDFLHSKIALLRRPNTNIQIIKESVLLRQQPLTEFLQDHDPSGFSSVRDDYSDTVSVLYTDLFKKYLDGLMQLKREAGHPGDTLVDAASSSGGDASVGAWLMSNIIGGVGGDVSGSGGGSVGVAGAGATSAFALGSRLDSVKRLLSPAVVLAVASSRGQRFYFEEIHRSIGKMLLDTCSAEAYFCTKLFGELPGQLFAEQFRAAIGSILDNLRVHVASSCDVIGLLLALKVNELLRAEMTRRRVADLSDFFLQAEILLKPRVKELCDANVRSLAAADARALLRSQADVAPRIVTRRYAELNAALLVTASFGAKEDSTIRETVRRHRMEFQSLMQRIAALFSRPKARYVFLINNYDLVLTVMDEYGVRRRQDVLDEESNGAQNESAEDGLGRAGGSASVDRDEEPILRGTNGASIDDENAKSRHEAQAVHEIEGGDKSTLAAEESAMLEDAVAGHVAAYVEQELGEHFADLVAFVRSTQKYERTGRLMEVSETKLRLLMRDFMSNYRVSIQHIRSNVLREFPNLKNGVDILKRCLVQLLNYHRRFEAVLTAVNPQLKSEMVATAALMHEIRKASAIDID